MKPYLIYAPPYRHQSAGVRLLHYLCHVLNETGRHAMVRIYDECRGQIHDGISPINPQWNELLWDGEDDDWITFYPETVFGNPLKAKHVVRWLANRPGFFTRGQFSFGEDELQFAYSRIITDDEKVPVFTLWDVDPKQFCPERRSTEDWGPCFYVGKGRFFMPTIIKPDNVNEISDEWPVDRDDLATLLGHSRYLLSYDPFTMLNYEATLCGCPVIIKPTGPWLKEDFLRMHDMDGQAWDTDEAEIERARATVHLAYPKYLEFLRGQPAAIDAFVKMTQERFA